MTDVAKYFRWLLLALTLLHLGMFVRDSVSQLQTADGLMAANMIDPLGGDFINMFAAARLTAEFAVGREQAARDAQFFVERLLSRALATQVEA